MGKESAARIATPEADQGLVSIFLAEADARGLKSAGPYAAGRRYDHVSAELAARLVKRFGFTIVAPDFVPSTSAKEEG